MKERIVVDNRIYLNKEDFIEVEDIITDNLTTAKYTKEQVPENFSELKELCKTIKKNKKDLGGAMWFEFGCLNNDKMYLGKFLCVDEKGQVGIAERSWGGDISITIFAYNRTPAQMWQIIKNLIGEE